MTTKNTDFWLNEAELKTPEHDKMVLWCFKNAKKITRDLGLYKKSSRVFYINSVPNYDESKPYYGDNNTVKQREGYWDWEKEEFILGTKYLEHIKKCKENIEESNRKGREISTWDLSYLDEYLKKRAEYELLPEIIKKDYLRFCELLNNRKEEEEFDVETDIEFHITDNRGWNIGFTDLRFHLILNRISTNFFGEEYNYFNEYILLEIKPYINSIGEVMRQINHYRSYTHNTPFILVTKTTDIKEIFESQKVYYYNLKEEEYLGDTSYLPKQNPSVPINSQKELDLDKIGPQNRF